MTVYEPGTVAIATVNGQPNIRVMRMHSNYSSAAWAGTTGDGPRLWEDRRVTDVRPLVVLDLEQTYGCSAEKRNPAAIVARLRQFNSVATQALADQIEAQTKPARIPEPGLWGVVEASAVDPHSADNVARCQWVHIKAGWCAEDDGYTVPWVSLIDPVLIREGV